MTVTEQIKPEEILDWHEFTFVYFMKKMFKMSTDAPPQYGEVTAIQELGHALGYKPVNLIAPHAVRHNSYLGLVGESTLTRKTTAQTFGTDIWPQNRRAPEETSPEQFLVRLSKSPELLQFLPELTHMLKGISGKGYMARFTEDYNELHKCPELYVRELRERKGKENVFEIKKGYLSVHSTVTPEMLEKHLTDEFMYGGFLARFLLVYGEANPRPRQRLNPKVTEIKDGLRENLLAVIAMEKEGANFILSDKALARYNELEKNALQAYKKIGLFVGRYMNYVVGFADILLVSDALGMATAKGISPYSYRQLVDLVRLKSLVELDKINRRVYEKYSKEEVTEKWVLSNYFNTINYTNPTNLIIVPSEYIDRSWKIIQPCLDYVLELANYVEMARPLAKVRKYLKKVKKSSRSKTLQNTNLRAKIFDEVIETLEGRNEIKIERVEYSKHGRAYKHPNYIWIGD